VTVPADNYFFQAGLAKLFFYKPMLQINWYTNLQ